MEVKRLISVSYVILVHILHRGHSEVRFVCPRPQVPTSNATQGPCDPRGLAGRGDVTDVTPGPLTVRWEDTIFRKGAPSRIALKSRSSASTCVLLDQVPHNDNQFTDKGASCSVGDYPMGECRRSSTVIAVTIPDITCDDCYLQLLSVDTSSLAPGDEPCSLDDANSTCPVYYSCANIKIWPTPSGEGRSLDSCLPYPENLDGPWPFSPISVYGVSPDFFSQFYIKDLIELQGSTLMYDVEPRGLPVSDVVPGTPGFYDVATGLQMREFQSVSPGRLVFRGRSQLTPALITRLQSNTLAIGLRSVSEGLVIFPLEAKSTRFGQGQYVSHSALYSSRGLLRPHDPAFAAQTTQYTTPFLQAGQCAMETSNANAALTVDGRQGEVLALFSMSTLEYNLFVTGIVPRPNDFPNNTDLGLTLTRTFGQTFKFTSRQTISEKSVSMSSRMYVVDGVDNMADFLTLTSGNPPDTAEARLSSGDNTRTLRGTFVPGISAVVRDEWDQITGLATVEFLNRTTLDTKLLVVNFTFPPQLGGLHGPALTGRSAPSISLPTSNVSLSLVADSSWLVTAFLTINSAQAIRHMWSGRHYIDIRRSASTPQRAISGQLIKPDTRLCQTATHVACLVSDLTTVGFSRTQSTVSTNAFAAFLPDDASGVVQFSIIVRDLQPEETVTSLVLRNGGSSQVVTPTFVPSQQESGALEGEGEFRLEVGSGLDNSRSADMTLVLFTSRFPSGTITGFVPELSANPQPFGAANRTSTAVQTSRTVTPAAGTVTDDDFTLECGSRSSGPMRIVLTNPGGPIAAVYAERFSDTCPFINQGSGTWVLSSARLLNGSQCGVQVTTDNSWVSYEVTVVVQVEPLIQTGEDTRYSLSCNFTGSENTARVVVVSSSLDVRSKPAVRKQEVIRGQVDQNYSLQIHGAADLSRPISSVVIGDPIVLSVTMSGTDQDEQSLKVRQCVARGTRGREVVFLDDYCSVLRSVLPSDSGFVSSGTRANLFGLKAFRLQDAPDDVVIFSCIVEPCSDTGLCDGNNCVRSSRRRRQTDADGRGDQGDAGGSSAVRIAVQYRVSRRQDDTDHAAAPIQTGTDDGASLEATLLVVVSVVSALLVLTSVVVVIVVCQLRGLKRQQKKAATASNS